MLWDPGGIVTQLDALRGLCQAVGWQLAIKVLERVLTPIWGCSDPGLPRFAALGDENGSETAKARTKGAFVGTDELEGSAKEPVNGSVFFQACARAVVHKMAARARYFACLGADSTEVRACWLA